MSAINTNAINTTYPTPGINNSTQGFRDNFASIKNNLDTASSEITDIQQKGIFKTALNGLAINNDMGNTIIANAATQGFRSTTYYMGSSLPTSPSIIITDVSRADVHYGVIVGDTVFQFGGWAPAGTKSTVELHLFVASGAAGSNIAFPSTTYNSSSIVTGGMKNSVYLLENYFSTYASNNVAFVHTIDSVMTNITHTNQVSVPAGVSELQYKLTTIDCGTTIDIEPINRPQKSTAINLRTPTAVGEPGDKMGTICTNVVAGNVVLYMCKADYDGTSTIWQKTTFINVT